MIPQYVLDEMPVGVYNSIQELEHIKELAQWYFECQDFLNVSNRSPIYYHYGGDKEIRNNYIRAEEQLRQAVGMETE